MTKSEKEQLLAIYQYEKEQARLSFNNKNQPQSDIDNALENYAAYEKFINNINKIETTDDN